VDALALCSKLFFDYNTIDEQEEIFAFNSDVTRELWFCYPAHEKAVKTGALCYDVRFDTVSQIDKYYSAGTNARIERNEDVEVERQIRDRNREEETVTLLGQTDGCVKIYGRANEPRRELGGNDKIHIRCAVYSDDWVATQSGDIVTMDITPTENFFSDFMVGSYIMWEDKTVSTILEFIDERTVRVDDQISRTQADICVFKTEYDSYIDAGWESFGDDFNEKDMRSYALLGGSDNETAEVSVKIFGVTNTTDDCTAGELCNDTLDLLNKENLLPTFFRANYFRDRITATGRCDASIAGRIFEWVVRRSRSITRT
jgi:hypothetical protein